MSTYQHTIPTAGTVGVSGGEVSSELHRETVKRMSRLASTVDRLATRPGALIYLGRAKLTCQLVGIEPVVFSAFDASTHLQVARIYLTQTFASAVDFLNFIRQKFSFRIGRIRTAEEEPFYVESPPSVRQRFSSHLEAEGILHSIVSDQSTDDLFAVFTQLSFAQVVAKSGRRLEEPSIMREFISYLYDHNNYKELPTLKGKTPLEKLKLFGGFDELESFDPFAPAAEQIDS
jgi:hypothetical protein